MFFLLRLAFWLSIVIMLLPTGSSAPKSAAAVDAGDAVSAATAAVSDMGQFCTRQPEACAVGSQVAVAFGYKAQAAAKLVYEFLTEKLGPAQTGSVAAGNGHGRAAPAMQRSQSTLGPGDLEPTWRAPAPHKEARRNRPA